MGFQFGLLGQERLALRLEVGLEFLCLGEQTLNFRLLLLGEFAGSLGLNDQLVRDALEFHDVFTHRVLACFAVAVDGLEFFHFGQRIRLHTRGGEPEGKVVYEFVRCGGTKDDGERIVLAGALVLGARDLGERVTQFLCPLGVALHLGSQFTVFCLCRRELVGHDLLLQHGSVVPFLSEAQLFLNHGQAGVEFSELAVGFDDAGVSVL